MRLHVFDSNQPRTTMERLAGAAGLGAFAIAGCVALLGLPPRPFRGACIILFCFLCCAFCVLYLVSALKTGKLRHRLGDTDRLVEPGRYWIGLLTRGVFLFSMLALVTVFCWHKL